MRERLSRGLVYYLAHLQQVIYERTLRSRPDRVIAMNGDGDRIEPSVIDQLADVGTSPEEVQRRMTAAADGALGWCRKEWPALPTARNYMRNRIREVYKGRRFSGFNAQKTTEKLIGARVKLYKKELAAYNRERAIELKRDERDRAKGRAAATTEPWLRRTWGMPRSVRTAGPKRDRRRR